MLARVTAFCALAFGLSALSLQAQNLFVLPGPNATNGYLEAFTSAPLSTYRVAQAGTGTFALLPNLNASEFYAVSNSTTNSILAFNNTLLSPSVVASLPASASQALITPNGSLLAVAAGQLHLFSTATNTEIVPGGLVQGLGITTFAIASSLDSTAIFALGSQPTGTSVLTAISTVSYAGTASYPLTELATAVSIGPNGLVYVSLPDEILELNPQTLQPTPNGGIAVTGTPGPLVFTPDGQFAVGANQSATGNSLIVASLATHTASSPALGLVELTSFAITGVDTVLAISNQGSYEVSLSPVSATPLSLPNLTGGVLAAATTNDVPTATHSTVEELFLLSSNTVYEYAPSSNSVLAQYQVAANVTPGLITYSVPVATAPQAQPATLLSYGNNQTILPSSTSEPIVVQVLDAANVPLSGYGVTFQISGSGATLSAGSAITGSNGYALTYVNSSSATGPVTVNATAGSINTSFSLNVSLSTSGSSGPTLTIIAGQGQLMATETSTANGPGYGSSLQVLATDANGNPIAGLPVTFTVPASEGTLQVNGQGASSQTVSTNASGIAAVDFETTLLPDNDVQGYLQTQITAAASNTNTVTFYITTVPLSPSPSIYFLAPNPGAPLTGAEGTVLPGAVKAQAISSVGFPIPNLALTLSDGGVNPTLYPSASCNAPGGLVFSNANGIVTCDVVLGPRVGSGTFTAVFGVTHFSDPTPFTVTAGTPSTIQITQGNNQTGGPGQTLPLALVVHVTDSGGNVVAGAQVNWQVVTAGTVTLSQVINVTDNTGDASALATLGNVGGTAQVKVTAGSASAIFNLTVNIPSVGIQKVSGDQQTATINTAFPLPLTVKVVDSKGNGVAGAQVNFTVASGSATLGSSSAITNSSGQASTTVTAGANPGTITITATTATFTATFTLTAIPPGPANITILNGASFDPNTGISPGGIATINGTGLLPGVQGLLTPASGMPTTFSGVTVTFNGTAAPIYYVEHTSSGTDQVTVQVPFEVQPGPSVSLEINVANEGSTTIQIPVLPVAPGVFTSVYSGKTYAVAVRPDGSQVSPTNPAQRGETIQIYVTGLGQATPAIATGAPGVANQTITSTLFVGLNNAGVPLISAVYGPGLVGVYVITMQVPEDTQTGPYQPLGVLVYDSQNNPHYAQSTFIPIQ